MPTQGKGHNLGIRNTCYSISAPYLLSSRNDFDEILVVMCRTQDNILAQGLGHNLRSQVERFPVGSIYPWFPLKLSTIFSSVRLYVCLRQANLRSKSPFEPLILCLFHKGLLLLNEQWHEISNIFVCATSKGSDQPAHTRRLIRALDVKS